MIHDSFVPVKPQKGEYLVSTKLSSLKGLEVSLRNLLLFFLSGLIYII